jgi:hypothetical protein
MGAPLEGQRPHDDVRLSRRKRHAWRGISRRDRRRFAATVGQWVGYEEALQSLFAQYGVKRFHSRKFRGKDWPHKRRAEFHSKFLRLSDENLGFGFAAILKPIEYAEIYRAGEMLRRARPDTEYGLCLRVAMWRAVLFMNERREDWPLNLVMEDGHKNVGDALRVYSEVKESFPAGLFNSITFQTKDDCLPLAAADHFAYSLFRFSAGMTGDPEEVYMPAGPADPPYVVHKIPIRRVLITRESLADLRNGLGQKQG